MSRKSKANAQRRQEKRLRSRRVRYLAAGIVLLGAIVLCSVSMLRSYPAGETARKSMESGQTDGRVTVFEAEKPKAGLIFYPGGLVEHEAYAPLMQALAERGVTSLLVEMPLDLAVLDADAAQGLAQRLPEIDAWMIGGHSLGGAMAADYAAKHPDAFDALVLLGAYAAKDLSATDMQVLSILGSEDGVLNREKYEASRKNYPAAFREFVIEGGCHAYFGDYGEQRGDGTPRISREMQIGMTASAIAALRDGGV